MFWYNFVSVVALILSLAGNVLVNYKKRLGFVVWTLSNFAWIAVNFMAVPNWSQVAMYVVYALLNFQGWIVWSRKVE